MKPKKLVMSAFGSYAGVETIDFERMDHGLFLIAGDTGSGKSTIFDAIMFALYDTMSSKERKGNMMRSEYAKEATETYVEYTFSYGAADAKEIYTVKRYPSYERRSRRKNKNGEYGMTKQPGKVSLILPDGKEFDGKAAQTNQKIQEIIGLSAEQFGKIAMIAQGEFQELIMDKTGKRKEIFQQIFSTEIYDRVQKKIAERFKQSVIAEKENATKLRETVVGLEFAEGEKKEKWEEVLSFLETEPERIEAFLEEAIIEEKKAEKEIRQEAADSQKDMTKKEVAYQDAVHGNQLLQEYQRTCEKKESLEKQKEVFEKKQRDIAVIEKAQLVLVVQEKYHREKKEKERLEEKRDYYRVQEKGQKKQLQEILEKQKRWKEQYDSRMPDIVREQEKIKEEMLVLDKLTQCQENLEKLAALAKKLSEKWDTKKQEEEKLLKEQKEIGQWIEEHSQTEVQLEKARHQLEKEEEADKKLQHYQKLYVQWESDRKEQEKAEKTLYKEQKEWLEARRGYEEKEQKYLALQSAFLAQKLQDGKPCPVCGSCTHPTPAPMEKETVTKEMLDQAAKKEGTQRKCFDRATLAFQTAKVVREQSERKVLEEGKLVFDREELAKKVLEEREIAQSVLREQKEKLLQKRSTLEQREKELLKQQTKMKEQQKLLADISTQIPKLQESEKKLLEQKQECSLQQKSMETQEHMLLEKVTIFSAEEGKKLKKRLEEELQSLQEQGEKLEKSASQKQKEYDTLLGNQAENGKRWMEYCEFVKNSYAEYQQERKKQGFADKETYEQALQQRDQLEQWKKEIDQYRIETVQCDTRCHTLREQIQGRKKEDTQLLAKQKEEAKRAYEEKKSEQEVITYHLETVKRVKKRVTELLKGRGTLLEEGRVIRSLQNAANGKMQFQTYVLRQYFQKIIQAANIRLKKMTTNPFLLKCREWNVSGLGEAGLDLDVWNPLTGKSRDAHTLSGGETFLASLSMALGMADVVQNTVGKTHLDTMFIDEGFGSLSEDVRTTAVKVLLELAGENRLVGVISHVSELKEQIPNKLYVTKDSNGSRVQWQQD